MQIYTHMYHTNHDDVGNQNIISAEFVLDLLELLNKLFLCLKTSTRSVQTQTNEQSHTYTLTCTQMNRQVDTHIQT